MTDRLSDERLAEIKLDTLYDLWPFDREDLLREVDRLRESETAAAERIADKIAEDAASLERHPQQAYRDGVRRAEWRARTYPEWSEK